MLVKLFKKTLSSYSCSFKSVKKSFFKNINDSHVWVKSTRLNTKTSSQKDHFAAQKRRTLDVIYLLPLALKSDFPFTYDNVKWKRLMANFLPKSVSEGL